MKSSLKKKDESLVGKEFWFIGDKSLCYPCYQGKITQDLGTEVVGMVVNQAKTASKEEIEVRVAREKIRIKS